MVRLPDDIEALVVARVNSGDFSTPEEVVRTAMGPWIERERMREDALAGIRMKVAEGDADPTDFSPSAIRDHLDQVVATLQRNDPDAA